MKAEKIAAEAFEAARAIGVIMYDIPDCMQKHYEIETSHINGGESTTHAVTASFETAFEVDKQVAAAVKSAFIKLANCSSINKNEFKELLRKISQNPDTSDSNQELNELSSECESDTGSELESGSLNNNICSQDFDGEVLFGKARQRKFKKQQISEKLHMTKLVDMMLERLKCLQEDELASLATIVATCGLNATLAESENCKQHSSGSAADYTPAVNLPRRVSSFGAGRTRNINMDGQRQKQVETELPSLDKFLVKRLTRLEREVQEAKNSRRNEAMEGCGEKPDKPDDEKVCSVGNNVLTCKTTDLGSILVKHKSKLEKEIEEARKNSGEMFGKNHKLANSDSNSSEVVPDFGSMLTRKHVSKLEKEIEETKRNYGNLYESNGKIPERVNNRAFGQTKQDGTEIPSLDKVLVKHVSRLEREVQEAKNGRKREPNKGCKGTDSASFSPVSDTEESISFSDGDQVGKENIDLNQKGSQEVDMKQKGIPQHCSVETSIPIDQTILEAAEALLIQDDSEGFQNSLDKIMVKPIHRLEREKMQALSVGSDDYRVQRHKKRDGGSCVTDCESLDKVLVKHVSRLEKEKMKLGTKEEEVIKVVKRRDTNTQLEKSEGSLDQILVKPKSRLEREKMAAVQQPDDQIKHSATRREAREKELQEAWGGLSLGNSIRPHQSRLQRDKASLFTALLLSLNVEIHIMMT